MNWLTYQTMCATEKIMSEVRSFCMRSPSTSSHMPIVCGSGTSSVVTSHGPSGLNVSHDLPLSHCPPRSSWNSRSDTSFDTA
jgi:hypothetical protein